MATFYRVGRYIGTAWLVLRPLAGCYAFTDRGRANESEPMIQTHLATAENSVASLTGILSGLQSFPLMPAGAANAITHAHGALAALLAAVQLLHAQTLATATTEGAAL